MEEVLGVAGFSGRVVVCWVFLFRGHLPVHAVRVVVFWIRLWVSVVVMIWGLYWIRLSVWVCCFGKGYGKSFRKVHPEKVLG